MPVFQTQSMQKNRLLLAIAAFVLLSAVLGIANGQMVIAQSSDTSVTTAEVEEATTSGLEYLIAFSTFIVSGVFYAASGWIKKIRRKLAGDNVPLDYQKLGKTTLIGVILGIGAFIYSTWDGDTIAVTTAQEFFVQVGINTTVILFVDKWILGRSEAVTSTSRTNDPGLSELHESEPTAIETGSDPNA